MDSLTKHLYIKFGVCKMEIKQNSLGTLECQNFVFLNFEMPKICFIL